MAGESLRPEIEEKGERDEPTAFTLSDLLEGGEDEKSEMDKIFAHLLDPNNIAQLTDLSKKEIAAFTIAATVQQRYNLPSYARFFASNLIYRVSRSRQGRKELTRIVSRQMEKEDVKDIKSYGIFGRRRGMQP